MLFNITDKSTKSAVLRMILKNQWELIILFTAFSLIRKPRKIQTIKLTKNHEIAAPLVPKFFIEKNKMGR